jgi:DNA-binding MarR family transcriptional regulator
MSRRSDLTRAIDREIRREQVRTDAFDDAVASALGLNRSDLRCIDVLDQEGPLPAGRLAKAVGLSTAAITTAVDRLEARGFVVRRDDPADRRRVVIELTPKVPEAMWRFYAPLAKNAQILYDRFTDDELGLVLRFLETASEQFGGMVEELQAELRKGGG